MDVQYSEYTLAPLKRANRLSSLEPKRGVFLRSGDGYADYFPHSVLGDRAVDQFLQEFKFQKEDYDKKVLALLKKDPDYQKTPSKPFRNHQLWSGIETLRSPIVKYKIMNHHEDLFLELFHHQTIVRFDGNALFNRETLNTFIDKIPEKHRALIEYMEDPLLDTDWSHLPVKAASDFIAGSPADFTIYKPNAEFYPETSTPVIFSGYMGSELGFWHSYCELLERGDLNLVHGLVIEDFYEEQKVLFKGDYFKTFAPDLSVVKSIYQDLSNREWRDLCSI